MKKEGKFSLGRYCVANRGKPSFSVERVPVKSSGGAISLNGAVSSTGTVSQPFQWSSEYHDLELSLTYYNFRHYNPTDGRWLSRDPAMEYDARNLFEFARNSPIDLLDEFGLWLAWRHERLTINPLSSYEFQIDINGKSIFLPIKEDLLEIIVDANVDTDSGEMGRNQSYHYCTDLDKNEIFKEAKENYTSTLAEESKKFQDVISRDVVSRKDCEEALKTLGRLNHVWQDYYAHGVKEDDKNRAIIGEIQGSPEAPAMKPVSYGSKGFRGGHGGFWRVVNPFSRVEPGNRADDSDVRKQQAESYTKTHSILLLNAWIVKCKCHFYSKEINK